MGNPLMKAMRSAISQPEQGNVMARFLQFCRERKGQNPEQIIQQLLASGQITPEQLEHAKKRATEIQRAIGGK